MNWKIFYHFLADLLHRDQFWLYLYVLTFVLFSLATLSAWWGFFYSTSIIFLLYYAVKEHGKPTDKSNEPHIVEGGSDGKKAEENEL